MILNSINQIFEHVKPVFHAKNQENHFKEKSEINKNKVKIYSDMCGLINIENRMSYRYLLIFTDKNSRYMSVYLISYTVCQIKFRTS